MNLTEEEKKKLEQRLRELNDDNITIVDSPSEAVEKISPTRLKLQAISFTVIGKIQQFFLKEMVKQLKTAQSLAESQIGELDMPEKAKEEFLESLRENVSFLEDKMANFKENYGRLKQHAKRVLATPNRNFRQLKLLGDKVYSKEYYNSVQELSAASKALDEGFVAGQNKYKTSPKPIKENQEFNVGSIDIMAIKNEVNKALAQSDEKKLIKEAKKDINEVVVDKSKEAIVEFKDKDLSEHLDNLLNEGQVFTPVENKDNNPIFGPYPIFDAPLEEPVSFKEVEDEKIDIDDVDLDPDIQKELEEAERELEEAARAKKSDEDLLKEIKDRARREQEELERVKREKEESRKALEEKKRQEEETRKMAIQAQREIEIRKQIQAKREEAAKIAEARRVQQEQLAKEQEVLNKIAEEKARAEEEAKKYKDESSKTDLSIKEYKAQLAKAKEELIKFKSAGVNRIKMAGEASPVFGDEAKGKSR